MAVGSGQGWRVRRGYPSVLSLPAPRNTARQAVTARQFIFECPEPDDRALATVLISRHIDQGGGEREKQHDDYDGNDDAGCERVVADAIIDVERQDRCKDHDQCRDEKAPYSQFVCCAVIGGLRTELRQHFDLFGTTGKGERIKALQCHITVDVCAGSLLRATIPPQRDCGHATRPRGHHWSETGADQAALTPVPECTASLRSDRALVGRATSARIPRLHPCPMNAPFANYREARWLDTQSSGRRGETNRAMHAGTFCE